MFDDSEDALLSLHFAICLSFASVFSGGSMHA